MGCSMRIEPRETVSWLGAAIAPLAAIGVALLLCSVLILWTGASVIEAYVLLFKGAFGSAFALNETLTRSIPLIFTGLAAAVAFRAKFYNCLLYTSPSPRDQRGSRMPSSA